MKSLKIISLMIVLMFAFSLVSAVQLKEVKVEDLKEGDIIIDRYGNEIVVESIVSKPSESLTISEYLKQKINIDSLKFDRPEMKDKMMVGGSSGPGSITGNAIVGGRIENQKPGIISRMINKIGEWCG